MVWNPIPGVVENLLAEGLVAALIGGGVMAWVQERAISWLRPLRTGLGAAAIILVAFAAVRVIAIPVPERATTTDNIDGLIVTWLDNFRLTVKNDPTDQTIFRRIVTMPNGHPITIARSKQRERYIGVGTTIQPNPAQQKALDRLTKSQLAEMVDEVRAEAASRMRKNQPGGMMPLPGLLFCE